MQQLRFVRTLVYAAALVLTFIITSIADATDYFVDGSVTSSGDGFPDFTEAVKFLDEALALAEDGDRVFVAAGTYNVKGDAASAPRTTSFEVAPGVQVLGGFLGIASETDPEDANPAVNITILTGDIDEDDAPGQPATLDDNAYHVLIVQHENKHAAISTVVDGFTITAGYADGSGNDSIGGGAWLQESNGTGGASGGGTVFRRCIFEGNFAENAGGAVAGYRIGATFRDCVFRNNEVNGTTFETVLPGGGAVNIFIAKIIAANCRFESNVCHEGEGGALRLQANQVSGSVLANCDFRANTAATNGGAAVLVDESVELIAHVTNCVFAGNIAEDGDGGGVLAGSALLHHCTFAHNDAPNGAGGGCSMTDGDDAVVENCIFWKNTDDGSSGHGAQLSSSTSLCPEWSIIEDFTAFTAARARP